MKSKISCCFNCEKRELGCHGTCEQYQSESQTRKKELHQHAIENRRKYSNNTRNSNGTFFAGSRWNGGK